MNKKRIGMKELYKITLKNDLTLEQAWEILEENAFELAYGEEEENRRILYLYLNSVNEVSAYFWIKEIEKVQLPKIDWESQWALYGLDFKNGSVHLSFDKFGRKAEPILLKPGPGFGDLSHPTTLLVLELMSQYLTTQSVIDIGSGSGVLSLAALALGASFAYGVDIDPAAIEHAQENAKFNQMESQCIFMLPEKFQFHSITIPLIVMNMIFSEQKIAWNTLSSLHCLPGLRLISGIRQEERDVYFEQTKNWGWRLKEEKEKEGWLGFVFEC
ncbi:putative ribosomal protein L11 methyltransferase [Candidatus Protochlamydia amoebophila]|uniref:Putative ribosomal protein L11 methyltransferase n=2 Tax=Candidatus Protochlamydia amoebophila TaxID=362787 RepID=A0A0C1JTK0_9BACT|nr:putative ribosomal protein L11 methyltransferase [Candidatus Protochlamydia amoebophila]